MIYDEESDRHVHIPFDQALYATTYGHPDGVKGDVFDLAKLSESYDSKCSYNAGISVADWNTLGQIAAQTDEHNAKAMAAAKAAIGDDEAAVGGVFTGGEGARILVITNAAAAAGVQFCPPIPASARGILPLADAGINADVAGVEVGGAARAHVPNTQAVALKYLYQLIIACVKKNKWVPVELVICRPFIEHLMLSGIVAVAGRDTGATLFGPAGAFRQSSPDSVRGINSTVARTR